MENITVTHEKELFILDLISSSGEEHIEPYKDDCVPIDERFLDKCGMDYPELMPILYSLSSRKLILLLHDIAENPIPCVKLQSAAYSRISDLHEMFKTETKELEKQKKQYRHELVIALVGAAFGNADRLFIFISNLIKNLLNG